MSNIKLKQSSGSGDITLKAASSGSNAVELTLPNAIGSNDQILKLGSVSGQTGALSWADAGGGQILQVVAEEEANNLNNPSGYTTFFDLNITPVSATSKFIVHVSSFYMLNPSREILVRCRDSNSTYVGGIREFKNSTDSDIKGTFNTTWFMDQSYSTGSATTFIVEVDDNGDTTNVGSGVSTWKSTMIVYEVGTVNDG